MESKIKILHLKYAIGILAWTGILLFAYQYGANKEFLSHISLATGLASIILAIVAIFYSMITNSGLNNNLNKIQEASEKISSSSSGIEGSTTFLNSKIEEIPYSISAITKNLSEGIDLLKAKIEDIPSSISTVSKRIEEQGIILMDLMSLSKVETSGKPDYEREIHWNEKNTMSFITRISPFFQVKLLTIAAKPTELAELYKDKFNDEEFNFLYAFLNLSAAIDLLQFEPHSPIIIKNKHLQKDLILKCISNDRLSAKLKKIVDNIKGS